MSNSFDFMGYSFRKYPFMRRAPQEKRESESYVTVPPALWITDRAGNTWTLGFQRPARDPHNTGEFEHDIVKNGLVIGEWACRLEYRAGILRAFGHQGWRTWNGKTFI